MRDVAAGLVFRGWLILLMSPCRRDSVACVKVKGDLAIS